MPLRFTKYLEANFTNVADSDFVLKCGNKKFEVHRLVLNCWPFFERLLSSDWKETKDGVFTADAPEELFEQIVKFMYGAEELDVLRCCSSLSPGIMDEYVQRKEVTVEWVDAVKTTLKRSGLPAAKICRGVVTPESWRSRMAVDISLQLVKLYAVTDRYEMADLKDIVLRRLLPLINTSWSHSSILGVFDEIFTSLPEHDLLYTTSMKEIERRLFVLLQQPIFKAWLDEREEMQLAFGRFALQSISTGHVFEAHDSQGHVRYCSFIDEKRKIFCRLQVVTNGTTKNNRTCPNCGERAWLENIVPPELRWKEDEVERPAKRARVESSRDADQAATSSDAIVLDTSSESDSDSDDDDSDEE